MNPFCAFGATCTALAVLALVHSPVVHAYSSSDLHGPWKVHSSASGPAAPWWERARVTIGAGGSFTAFTDYSTGETGTVQGTFQLSPAGILTIAESATLRGSLDQGTTVMVLTDTWDDAAPGSTEMKVGLKCVGGYRTSDLAGEWEINTIASGPGAPWWQRGRVTVDAAGSFAGTFTDDQGEVDPVSGGFVVAEDGTFTFSGSTTALGALDAGRSVVVLTSTWTDYMPGTVDLSVGVKMAASYSLADLVGTWEMSSLATGPGAPWWSRAQFTVAPNGSFSGSTVHSDGGGGPMSGSFAITPQGVITRSGFAAARGVLDAHKTVMVWTDTWSTGSPGTSELFVATRTSGATLSVDPVFTPRFELRPAFPNPVRGQMPRVLLVLDSSAPAQLEVWDVSGRRIAAREVGRLGAGQHLLNVTEDTILAPGLYLVSLRQGGATRVTRVVVL